jgi:hypothetical protein
MKNLIAVKGFNIEDLKGDRKTALRARGLIARMLNKRVNDCTFNTYNDSSFICEPEHATDILVHAHMTKKMFIRCNQLIERLAEELNHEYKKYTCDGCGAKFEFRADMSAPVISGEVLCQKCWYIE